MKTDAKLKVVECIDEGKLPVKVLHNRLTSVLYDECFVGMITIAEIIGVLECVKARYIKANILDD